MSTIKSSAEHLTLNADGASKDIKFQANGVEKASISSAGLFTSTTIDATKLTGNLPAISGASLTSLTSGNLTGALPAISGASLTNLPAGGKVVQIKYLGATDEWTTSSTTVVDVSNWEVTITPSSTSNKIMCLFSSAVGNNNSGSYMKVYLYRGATEIALIPTERSSYYDYNMATIHYVDNPATTSPLTYKIRAKRTSGSGTLGINATNTSLIIMEVVA